MGFLTFPDVVCKLPEKIEFIIGISDFPTCFGPVSREKRIYDWNFGLFPTDIGPFPGKSEFIIGFYDFSGLLAARGLAPEGSSWNLLDFHGSWA